MTDTWKMKKKVFNNFHLPFDISLARVGIIYLQITNVYHNMVIHKQGKALCKVQFPFAFESCIAFVVIFQNIVTLLSGFVYKSLLTLYYWVLYYLYEM